MQFRVEGIGRVVEITVGCCKVRSGKETWSIDQGRVA
jgi:hypothetical protein